MADYRVFCTPDSTAWSTSIPANLHATMVNDTADALQIGQGTLEANAIDTFSGTDLHIGGRASGSPAATKVILGGATTTIEMAGTLLPPTGADVVFKAANNDGTKGFSFTDSDDLEIARIDSDGNVSCEGTMTVEGNFTVNGTTTTVGSATLDIGDNLILVNTAAGSGYDAGMLAKRWQTNNDAGTGDVVSDTAALSGTATGGDGTHITLQVGSSAVDDYYNGWWIKITNDTPAGIQDQVRQIIDYVGATRVAEVSAWTTVNPGASTTYNLYNRPYVGTFYDESADAWTWGATAGDPGAAPVVITAYIDGRMANLYAENKIVAATNTAANQGLTLPTEASSGTPTSQTGVAEGDVVWDSSGNNLYVYNGSSFSFIGGTSSTSTLNDAYLAGPSITMTTAGGDFDVSTAVLETAAISLDATAASNFTVDGNNLTLSTTTSGNVIISSAGQVSLSDGTLTMNLNSGALSESGLTTLNLSGSGAYTFTSGAAMTITCADTSAWTMTANTSEAETLTIDAVNGGSGTAKLILDADDFIDIGGASNTTISQVGTGQVTFLGNVDATNGLDVTTAALTTAAGFTQTGGAFTFTGSNINLDPTGTVDLAMDASQTVTITLADNLADAFLIQGPSAYLDITTTDGSEQINFGNAGANRDFNFLGAGDVYLQSDNQTLKIGSVGDYSVVHNGTNSIVTSFTGDLITDNTNVTGSTIMRLGTDTAATDFQVQNNSETPQFTVTGAGQATFAGNVDATNGLDVTNAVLSADTGVTVSGGALTFSGSNIDLDPTGTVDLAMDASQTVTITLADNLADAFLIQGPSAYLDITTTDGSEQINFGNAGADPDFNFLGTGDVYLQSDNQFLKIGDVGDFSIVHDGSDSIVTSTTGDLVFDNTSATGATTFQLGTDTNATSIQFKDNTGNTFLTASGDRAFDIDAAAASSFSVTGAGLTLETLTSGTLTISSAGALNVNADSTLSIATDLGSGAGPQIDITSAAGAAGTFAGGLLDFNAGAGGAGSGAGAAGGTGGAVEIASGAGGAGNTADAAGVGGEIDLTAGAGGTGGTTGDAGVGGAVDINAGAGGTGGSGASEAGGAGGDVTLDAGVGGDAAGSTNGNGGAGGDVLVTSGAGGALDGGGSDGTAGKIKLDSKINYLELGDLETESGAKQVRWGWGTSTPANSTGYGKGSVFIKVDTGILYINTGTEASVSWTIVGTQN
jgi:hypothetical protein